MNSKIPKVIHYCWFGGKPLPKLAQHCIDSWKEYFPDYEIKQWDETNFNIKEVAYISEAYEHKKWAFVSDYVRFYVLYNYGGIYFDTDVEVIKPFDNIVKNGNFLGCEKKKNETDLLSIAPGLCIGAEPKLDIFKELLEIYDNKHFVNLDGSYNMTTVVEYTTELMKKRGFCGNGLVEFVSDIWIYPPEYFCPMDPWSGKIEIEEETYSIHYYTASWQSSYLRFKTKVKRLMGKDLSDKIEKVKHFGLLGKGVKK